MTEPVDEPIRRSTTLQIGEHPEGMVVAITMGITKGALQRSKLISAAVYADDAAAWRAVREFASARLLENAEELIERPKKITPAPPVASPDDPF